MYKRYSMGYGANFRITKALLSKYLREYSIARTRWTVFEVLFLNFLPTITIFSFRIIKLLRESSGNRPERNLSSNSRLTRFQTFITFRRVASLRYFFEYNYFYFWIANIPSTKVTLLTSGNIIQCTSPT